ncbi:Lipase 3 [Orchesella cincta]|uniref:Lipase 3 n=1 Tax=Orchesella cincta TaxID=48709 RepID=A0A1D2NGD5_ORCCI|nr:Lipase 3 [Orchesella cincta]
MHEMGKYDVPAEIDHALKTANQTKLHYIGFSMGTSMFWIMCSTRPEYNEKIKLMTALAPVVFINNMVGFPRLIAPLESIVFPLLEPILHGEFLPPWLLKIYNTLGSFFCSNTFIAETICTNINFLYAGWDLPQSQVNQIPLFYSHTPSPTSTRTLSHIAQLINTGIFQEYDFGISQNLLVYGQPNPRKYLLERTTAPVALFYGPNDAVVNPDDVQRLASQLPNVVLNTPVNFSLWNHFDYHLGKDANELVNDRVLKLLEKF